MSLGLDSFVNWYVSVTCGQMALYLFLEEYQSFLSQNNININIRVYTYVYKKNPENLIKEMKKPECVQKLLESVKLKKKINT